MGTLYGIYDVLVRPQLKAFFAFLLLAVGLTLSRAPLPYLTGYMIDDVLPGGSTSNLLAVVALMAVLYALFAIFYYANVWLVLRVNRSIMIDLHQKALSGILGMNFNRRLKIHNGDLVSRLTRDVSQLDAIMPYGWSNLLHMLLLSAALLIVVFFLNWQLSSLLVLLIPVAVLAYLRFDKALWLSSEAETNASAKKLATIQETIEADTEVKAYDSEKFFVEHCQRAVQDFENKSLTRSMVDARVNIIIMVIPMLAIVLIWYLGGLQVMQDQMTIGLIVTYTATLAMLVPALVEIIDFASSYPNEVVALHRVKELFDAAEHPVSEETKPEPPTAHPLVSSLGVLETDQLNFSYVADEPLFHHLNLRFERGQAYLLNGGNGSGKSTLLTLLSGNLAPDGGKVLLNGHDLAQLQGKARLLTYVPQSIRIVSDSIRNNVTFGSKYTTEQIEKTLETVGLGDWVEGLDAGIDYQLENASSVLSGGQVQKIGLARALLRDTPILLFDEPTNNLDSQAVNLLIDVINQLKKSRIIIIVSHDDRLNLAVDHVLYLERNRLGDATDINQKS